MKQSARISLFLSLFCLIASLSTSVLAQDPTAKPLNFQESFQAGVQFYQNKKFPEAKEAFQKALELEQNNLQAMTNLALSNFQIGEKGWALALLRKAQNIDPDFSTPNSALKFILPQLEVKEIPHEITTWETIRSRFIQPFSQASFVVLTAIFLFAAGWTLIQYFSAKQKAEAEEKPYPAFPFMGLIYSLGFLFLFFLMLGKFYDLSLTRGTVVANKVSVLTLPDEKAPMLFDLYAGLEVLVLKNEAGWSQVQYPGGMTGWVKENSIFITYGKEK